MATDRFAPITYRLAALVARTTCPACGQPKK